MCAKSKGPDKLLKHCHLVEAEPGRVVLGGFKVQEEHCNLMGTLHGGISASLVDIVSTIALMKPESQDTKFGVSVNISTSYLSAARENDELVLIGRVIKEGKRLAFLESDILLKNGDKFIVKGAHTKFLS